MRSRRSTTGTSRRSSSTTAERGASPQGPSGDDPPLVLSLEPPPHGQGGALNHLGFRMPDAVALVATPQLRDDRGNTFPRGLQVTIDAATAERLRSPAWADQFLILG